MTLLASDLVWNGKNQKKSIIVMLNSVQHLIGILEFINRDCSEKKREMFLRKSIEN